MTNRFAVVLAALILGLLGWDYVYNGFDGSLFIARKLLDLIEWLAFWR